MKVTKENLATLLRLAHLSDDQIADISLSVAEAAYTKLVRTGLTIGANGDNAALHIRVGRAVNRRFQQWDQRTLSNGAEFAANTGDDGKAGTAAQYGMNSYEAYKLYGDEVGPDGPRRWRGGAFVEINVDYDENDVEELDGSVSAASAVQGDFDMVPAGTAAQTQAGLISQREKARRALDKVGIAWNDTPAPTAHNTNHE